MWDHPIQIAKAIKEEWGTSVLEVIVVLGIVAVMALVTGEAFMGATTTNQLGAVQKNVSRELRIARQWAVIRREAIAVTFVVGGSYTHTAIHRHNGRPLRRYDFSDKGVVVKSLSNGRQVVFYPSGRTATPTTIIVQGRRGNQVSLTVSFTGRVTVQ